MIVNAADSDGVRLIPVQCGKGQQRQIDGAFSRIIAAQGQGHIRQRQRIECHAELCDVACFGGGQATERGNADAGGVVVAVRHTDIIRIQAGVFRICAGGRVDEDGVADVAIIHCVINAGNGDDLRCLAVARSKDQAAQIDVALVEIIACQCDIDIGCGQGIKHHTKLCGSTCFGGT